VINERISFDLPDDTNSRIRNIVVYHGTTLSQWCAERLLEAAEEWERRHGGKYPERPAELRRGRPSHKSGAAIT
jgi:hypothetical protein